MQAKAEGSIKKSIGIVKMSDRPSNAFIAVCRPSEFPIEF